MGTSAAYCSTFTYSLCHTRSATAGAASLVRSLMCRPVCFSRFTTRRRTGVRRNILEAATQPTSPPGSSPSTGSKCPPRQHPSCSPENKQTHKHTNTQTHKQQTTNIQTNGVKLSVIESQMSCSSSCLLQGAEGAGGTVVLRWDGDGHRVERLHGGGGAGRRESGQGGEGDHDHDRDQEICS